MFISDKRLRNIERLLVAIAQKLDISIDLAMIDLALEVQNMATLEELTATAEKTKTTMDSAIVVINGIAERVAAAGTDPAKLQEIVDGLEGRAEALAFAIDASQPPASEGGAPVVEPDVPN